ncbi:DUF4387 domain-containing protein [Arthrobacter sulfonylureivorans]|uniref:DUF4387 domain-containing protein n=1 Tax=Arthrobacter sulfonylureivorans TaxID=2486855 RepID=A0ABY3W6X9_9MICC|nr:DUF4387 domain-containing protein [Arthrobacter sulfonylureivorans]UNK46062.1 DUF4387 domain-containing protein [Arthrobacter sulfonylureivorans]
MPTLGSMAQLIRSKNAGPWKLTIDVMFPDNDAYRHVVDSDVMNAATMGKLFGIAKDKVEIFHYDPANAIKISFPRPYPNGHPQDRDIFGGQQFAPLVDLEVPDRPAPSVTH